MHLDVLWCSNERLIILAIIVHPQFSTKLKLAPTLYFLGKTSHNIQYSRLHLNLTCANFCELRDAILFVDIEPLTSKRCARDVILKSFRTKSHKIYNTNTIGLKVQLSVMPVRTETQLLRPKRPGQNGLTRVFRRNVFESTVRSFCLYLKW